MDFKLKFIGGIIICVFILIICQPPVVFAAPVADHTVISQFSSLSQSSVNTASSKKVLFYHQSTGNNIVYYGMGCLSGLEYDSNLPSECTTYQNARRNNIWPYYDYSQWNLPEWPQPMANAIAKMDQFVSLVNQNQATYQYIGMKYCYVDGWNEDPNYYITNMETLERQYPSKTFFWTTSAINALDNINNPTIQAFNDAIRQYAKSHNKPLYDIADIESQGGACRTNGYETLCLNYRDGPFGGVISVDNSGHPDPDGSVALAKGLWWLMANLAGTPNPTNTPGPSPTPTRTPTPTPLPTATPTITPLPPTPTPLIHCSPLGDVNCDGSVNASDLALTAINYGGNNKTSDLDDNGKVNAIDLTILLKNWGLTAPTPTPTPNITRQYIQSSLAYFPSGAGMSLAFAQPVSNGNLVVVAVSVYAPGSAHIISVTDNKGNIYTRAVSNPSTTGDSEISIWYAGNVSGGSSFSVNLSAQSASSQISAAIHEYSGVSILDKTQNAAGTGAVASSGLAATTVNPNELVFGAFLHDSAGILSVTPGTSFSIRQNQPDGTNLEPLVSEDQFVSSIGSYNATLTWASSIPWRALVATFR